jgi:hypothetical protein
MTRLLLLILPSMLAGCAAAPTVGDDGGRPTPSGDPRAAGAYEVHEWGVVRAMEGHDELTAGAVAPELVRPMVMEKPVLYFHAAAPLHLSSVSATTRAGTVLESWPLGALGADHRRVQWSDLTITPGGACEGSPLPSEGDAPCSDLRRGLVCESPGLAVVRAEGAACVKSGDFQNRFLFYRASAEKLTPPLVFSPPNAAGEVNVKNVGKSKIPGLLVRVMPRNRASTTVVAVPPEPGQSITVGVHGVEGQEQPPAPIEDMTDPGAGPGPSALRMGLVDLGLEKDEADAFLRAWSQTFFARAPVAEEKSIEPPVPESFIYFLPAQDVEGLATLEMDPPPRAVKRAFAVWTAFATER